MVFVVFPIQGQESRSVKDLVYIDDVGTIKWRDSGKPAYFYGLNYTVPFAFSYRAHKYLNVNHETAIDNDIYHFARIGVNAFRVHVWDVEISDTSGNLIDNEHLRLLDYLISKLKERNIKIMLTPMAYWGDGYPEEDVVKTGFSAYYTKGKVNSIPSGIKAQEKYISQFVNHKNKYTNLSYKEDPDILFLEVNNEPSHSGEPQMVTNYINTMIDVCRKAGWTKPIFYNIAQNTPYYTNAILNSSAEGYTFQWYPTGLVKGNELRGNMLPYVDMYNIPFAYDKRFSKKAKVVYEFDAADVIKSYMYPAMARSFRMAGMQWATQFAYDPLALAYANPEYQTHYLNLAYTPSKAISMAIAAKVFYSDTLPYIKKYLSADSILNDLHVSYIQNLSEYRFQDYFYYTNNTVSNPENPAILKHIAGVGNSAIVWYEGTGAYFLDKLDNGIWRLEVMPDVFSINDPFGKPSLSKTVTEVYWSSNEMKLSLPDLSNEFNISCLNNSYKGKSEGGNFKVEPGAYLLAKIGVDSKKYNANTQFGNISLGEFVAPQNSVTGIFVLHTPQLNAIEGNEINVKATVVGLANTDSVLLLVKIHGWRYEKIAFVKKSHYEFEAHIPGSDVISGDLEYYIVVQQPHKSITFPGNHTGKPSDWNYYYPEKYDVHILKKLTPVKLFSAGTDGNQIDKSIYNWGRSATKMSVTTSETTGNPVLKVDISGKDKGKQIVAFRTFIGDKLSGITNNIDDYNAIQINAVSLDTNGVKCKVLLSDKDGNAFGNEIYVQKTKDTYILPLGSFKRDSLMLLPRPYPGFQPLYFKNSKSGNMDIKKLEVLELEIIPNKEDERDNSVCIEFIKFIKTSK